MKDLSNKIKSQFNEFENYSLLFKSREEIEQEIEEIKDLLFRFDLKNAEIFSGQISEIKDREEIRLIKKALGNAKMLYNLIRLYLIYSLYLIYLNYQI
jgi:type I restriction enzyme R subunit